MKFHRYLAALAAVAALVSAPAMAQTTTVVKATDLAYGAQPADQFDVYKPAGAPSLKTGGIVPTAPMIVMVHGGAWIVGDKSMDNVVTNKVLHYVQDKGFVLVSINYPMLPGADPYQQAQSVAQALAYIQANAASYGGDASRLILMGHSAGGHLVSLLNSDPSLLIKARARRPSVVVALDSAVYDVPVLMSGSHLPLYDRAFGTDKAFWVKTSPVQQLGALSPKVPELSVCSTRRDDSCPQAKLFQIKASKVGQVVNILPEDMTHSDINSMLGADNAYTKAVDAYLRSQGFPL